MRCNRVISGVLVAVALAALASAQEKPAAKALKVVRFGKLWDAKGKLWTNAMVVIDGSKILSVTSDSSGAPAGAEVFGLSKYTVFPGLLVSPIHTFFYTHDQLPTPPMPSLNLLTSTAQ